MKRYKVRNWEKYQHYKKRNPPWIKLHLEILTSKDWIMLADASRVLAIACMLLASKNDGYIPDDPEYLKRVAYLNTEPDFTQLIECGFLIKEEDASKMLANASISVSVSDYASGYVSEGGVGETIDFNGKPAQRHAMPDPLEDFTPEEAADARKVWSWFCMHHHGNGLCNVHTDSARKELRHFAKALATHGREKAMKVFTDYYQAPPKADKALAAWQIVQKLGLNAVVETKPPWEQAKADQDEKARKKLAEILNGSFRMPS